MHVPSTSHHPEEVTAVSNSIQIEKPQKSDISKETPQDIQDISSGNSVELNGSRNSKSSKASLSSQHNESHDDNPMETMISPSPIKEIPDLDCIMQDIQLPPPQEITISIEEKLDSLDFSSLSSSLFLNNQEQTIDGNHHENQINENQINNEDNINTSSSLLDEIHPISHFHHYIHTHTNHLYLSLPFPYS